MKNGMNESKQKDRMDDEERRERRRGVNWTNVRILGGG